MIVLEARNKKHWLIKLCSGEEFHCHLGYFSHDDIIGKVSYGAVIKLARGNLFIFRPTLRDFLNRYKKPTNIIYEEDAAAIVGLAGLGSGDVVVEIGTGSGGLTTYLANAVKPGGRVYTFDTKEIHCSTARENLELAGLSQWVEIMTGDVLENPEIIPVKEVESFFVDLPAPWLIVDVISRFLLPGGQAFFFIPNWSQVERLVGRALTENFVFTDIFEIIRRDYRVDPTRGVCHPANRQIVYTGIVTRAIKMIGEVDLSGKKKVMPESPVSNLNER
ncbi:MAG: tRNA (adenine-N1)-methyltransferase [Candidatus Odinarchaeota archaeon]